MSQEDLAAMATECGCKVSQAVLSRYESGAQTPGLEPALAIAKALGVSVDDLVEWPEKIPREME